MLSSHGSIGWSVLTSAINASSQRNNLIKLTHYDETWLPTNSFNIIIIILFFFFWGGGGGSEKGICSCFSSQMLYFIAGGGGGGGGWMCGDRYSQLLLLRRLGPSIDCLATDWTTFAVSKLKRRLPRLVWVYTCQNATLLKITSQLISYLYLFVFVSLPLCAILIMICDCGFLIIFWLYCIFVFRFVVMTKQSCYSYFSLQTMPCAVVRI